MLPPLPLTGEMLAMMDRPKSNWSGRWQAKSGTTASCARPFRVGCPFGLLVVIATGSDEAFSASPYRQYSMTPLKKGLFRPPMPQHAGTDVYCQPRMLWCWLPRQGSFQGNHSMLLMVRAQGQWRGHGHAAPDPRALHDGRLHSAAGAVLACSRAPSRPASHPCDCAESALCHHREWLMVGYGVPHCQDSFRASFC